jgi:hypothetical protein
MDLDPQRMVVTLTIADLDQLIEKAVDRALARHGSNGSDQEKLLTAEEAARLIGVDKNWLYSRNLPFKRKLSRKVTRYDPAALKKWVETRRK